MSLTADTARWFRDRRGISRETLEAFGITSEDEGILIPYPDGATKHRATLEKVDGKHRMWFDPKSPYGQPPFLPPDFQSGTHMIVFEGESDTMAAWQAAPSEAKPHILGISGANALGPRGIPDEKVQELFGEAKYVFFVFDNEDPYTMADQSVEKGKLQIKEKLGRKAKFVRLPLGPQDAAEFFQTYNWEAFRELMLQAMEVTYHFPALDLSTEPPEWDWLVENLLAKGDIAMLAGDGGVGKSWITMDLACHLARGEDTWLGMKLNGTKAMVIDQENPQVTVRQRLGALGLNEEHVDHLRYIWYQSILLDNPESVRFLRDDVEAFEPDILVLDSLSRMHLKNENENAEMNMLINGAIYPLARQLGITVVMIHHTRKDGGQRGATSIRNATDITLEMYDQTTKGGDKTGWQVIKPDKLRNVAPWGSALHLKREEQADGSIKLVTEEEVTII